LVSLHCHQIIFTASSAERSPPKPSTANVLQHSDFLTSLAL
jgi:hypothetical protein